MQRAGTADSRGIIRSFVTHQDKRFALLEEVEMGPQDGTVSGAITIDSNETYQSMLGFGAALTDAACFVIDKLEAEKQKEFMASIFSPSGLGLNCCRVCVGASDYATEAYSYADHGPDPELKNFTIEHDRAYLVPVVREARKLNPELFLVASPWSPPGWMKAGGSMFGGSMRRQYLSTYANYFDKFLDAYAEMDIDVDAISIQNEVDTDQEGQMPACIWTQGTESLFVAEHLGPKMAERKNPPKIWILDHNFDLWGRVLSQLSLPAVHKMVDGVAWHGYVGDPSAMSVVQKAHPEMHMYWTEGGPEHLTDPALTTNWVYWGTRFIAFVKNWARCIIAWNLALDENGYPNIGPFACAGLVTINSATHQISLCGQYWALAHFSKAVERDAVRIQSKGGAKGIAHVAFRNPDGTHVLILTNAGKERVVPVIVDGKVANLRIPKDSMVTAHWQSES